MLPPQLGQQPHRSPLLGRHGVETILECLANAYVQQTLTSERLQGSGSTALWKTEIFADCRRIPEPIREALHQKSDFELFDICD